MAWPAVELSVTTLVLIAQAGQTKSQTRSVDNNDTDGRSTAVTCVFLGGVDEQVI